MTETPDPPNVDRFPNARTDHECFGCGQQNPVGLRLRFTPGNDGVKASFTPSPEHQGFHDVVHGGIISTVLDEAMAWAVARARIWAVTGEMRVRFRHPLSVGEPTIATAGVSEIRGRIVTTSAELVRDGDRLTIATASATFVRVSADVETEWRARYLQHPNDPVASEES